MQVENRRRLPNERPGIIHKFTVRQENRNLDGYLIVGLYEDGQPGEIFIELQKEGSTLSGWADSFAIAISLGLQYGVPLKKLVDKFEHTRFEPQGLTSNRDIGFASSVIDYIFRWMGMKFLKEEGEGK